MFSDLFRKRNLQVREGSEAATPGVNALSEGATVQTYAKEIGVNEQAVWTMIREGQLYAKAINGDIHVFKSSEQASKTNTPKPQGPIFDEDDQSFVLPPLPVHTFEVSERQETTPSRPGASVAASAQEIGLLAIAAQRPDSAEFALLLDHLSLAKEENREILRLCQESLRKVTDLTESIVEMKDAVIEAKQTQIASLESQLDQYKEKVRALHEKNEDLETLARTVLSQK